MSGGYSWTLLVDGQRMASGSGPDEASNASEGFRYFTQYLSEGACVLTMRRGRKTIAKAQGGVALTPAAVAEQLLSVRL